MAGTHGADANLRARMFAHTQQITTAHKRSCVVFGHGKRIALRGGPRHFRAMPTVQEIEGRREIESGFREKPCEEEL